MVSCRAADVSTNGKFCSQWRCYYSSTNVPRTILSGLFQSSRLLQTESSAHNQDATPPQRMFQGLYSVVSCMAADFSKRKVLLTMEMLLLPNKCFKNNTRLSLVEQQTSPNGKFFSQWSRLLQSESSADNGDAILLNDCFKLYITEWSFVFQQTSPIGKFCSQWRRWCYRSSKDYTRRFFMGHQISPVGKFSSQWRCYCSTTVSRM